MRKYFLILAVLGCLTMMGCASAGTNFPYENINQLVVNKTTIAEAVALFGQPTNRGNTSDEKQVLRWGYASAVAFVGVTESKELKLYFNEDGILEKYDSQKLH